MDRTLAAFGLCFICGYFLLLARPSLDAYFTPDDCMNLYRSWIYPTASLIKANLLFLLTSPFERPMGSVYYSAIYHFVGFHAAWFHIVALTFLTANVLLTYAVARRLSGSRLAGLLTALLACYEGRFTSLYFNTGYIYDVLCYFFSLAVLLSYLRVRQKSMPARTWSAALITLLYICALNSKEMAIMLPAFMLAYEALYNSPPRYSPGAIVSWLFHECRLALVLSLVSVLFVIGRAIGPDTALTNPAYQPLFTWERFMRTSQRFLDALFYLDNRFTPGLVLLVWGVTGAAALISRSRALRFAWIFAMLSVLPIAFLPPRGGPQYYVPLFGWALYAGVAAAMAGQWLLHRLLPKVGFRAERTGAAALLTGLVLFLYPHYRALGLTGLTAVTVEAPAVHSIVDQLHTLHPVIPHGSRILFLDDPYPVDWQNMVFVVRLSYGDDSLAVERLKQMKQTPGEKQIRAYNLMLDYRAGRFTDGKWPRPAASGPSILVGYAAGGALVAEAYHSNDWEIVSADNPARPGERIILKAMDLGATNPAIASGQPFPQEPLARLAVPIDATVNGRAAAVEEKLGWPGEVDLYRVDIRLPRETESGLARIDLSENGVTSAAAMLNVRR